MNRNRINQVVSPEAKNDVFPPANGKYRWGLLEFALCDGAYRWYNYQNTKNLFAQEHVKGTWYIRDPRTGDFADFDWNRRTALEPDEEVPVAELNLVEYVSLDPQIPKSLDKFGQLVTGFNCYGQPLAPRNEAGELVFPCSTDLVPLFPMNLHSKDQDFLYDEYGVPVTPVSANGQAILPSDKHGMPIFPTDDAGNIVWPVDDQQLPYPPLNYRGVPFVKFDVNGFPIVPYDDKGLQLVMFDAQGVPIRLSEFQTKYTKSEAYRWGGGECPPHIAMPLNDLKAAGLIPDPKNPISSYLPEYLEALKLPTPPKLGGDQINQGSAPDRFHLQYHFISNQWQLEIERKKAERERLRREEYEEQVAGQLEEEERKKRLAHLLKGTPSTFSTATGDSAPASIHLSAADKQALAVKLHEERLKAEKLKFLQSLEAKAEAAKPKEQEVKDQQESAGHVGIKKLVEEQMKAETGNSEESLQLDKKKQLQEALKAKAQAEPRNVRRYLSGTGEETYESSDDEARPKKMMPKSYKMLLQAELLAPGARKSSSKTNKEEKEHQKKHRREKKHRAKKDRRRRSRSHSRRRRDSSCSSSTSSSSETRSSRRRRKASPEEHRARPSTSKEAADAVGHDKRESYARRQKTPDYASKRDETSMIGMPGVDKTEKKEAEFMDEEERVRQKLLAKVAEQKAAAEKKKLDDLPNIPVAAVHPQLPDHAEPTFHLTTDGTGDDDDDVQIINSGGGEEEPVAMLKRVGDRYLNQMSTFLAEMRRERQLMEGERRKFEKLLESSKKRSGSDSEPEPTSRRVVDESRRRSNDNATTIHVNPLVLQRQNLSSRDQ
ncbi:unnamed protein product, partial [Mesorhabditis spiculigera]